MTAKPRRTKIVTTLGPSTDKEGILEAIIEAGANVVRMNFSHGTPEDHQRRASQVRTLAAKHKRQVAILGDLQGPKIRVARFKNGSEQLKPGQPFILDCQLADDDGDANQVGLDYKALPNDVSAGDVLLLDDGRIQLTVTGVESNRVLTKVLIGGKLSNNKGINKKGGGLSADALTEKDKNDILHAAKIGVDYLAVSFPRNGEDMKYARRLATDAGLSAKLVAKVERAETVSCIENIDDIIEASDAVMVARGDLGVEIGDPELIGVQKQLIKRARALNRAVITATQMMESMMDNPMPTRAEVMDVANAVLDGTDAVMLSGETAAGKYPVETVKSMAEVCLGAEKMAAINRTGFSTDAVFENGEEAIAMSTMFAANHIPNVRAILTLTESGRTALMMSRIRSGIPIYALSRNEDTLNRMALYRGVYPVYFDTQDMHGVSVAKSACQHLKQERLLKEGDLVLITQGDVMDVVGSTNCLRVLEA